MDDSTLWAAAIGIGLLGLVLLAVGTLAAVYWSSVASGARKTTSTGQPSAQPKAASPANKTKAQTKKAASTGESHRSAPSLGVRQPAGGSFMAWIKAWIFAFIHASTVSLVMGSITFFEDMLRANEEIERTGTVSFPKQLLPGTVTGSAVRKRLSRPSGDSETGDEAGESGQSADSSSKAVKWEVVDVLDEAGDADND